MAYTLMRGHRTAWNPVRNIEVVESWWVLWGSFLRIPSQNNFVKRIIITSTCMIKLFNIMHDLIVIFSRLGLSKWYDYESTTTVCETLSGTGQSIISSEVDRNRL